jgi:hypothetical protein
MGFMVQVDESEIEEVSEIEFGLDGNHLVVFSSLKMGKHMV